MISVIIPVFNAERYLEVCLNSLWKQSNKDFEVIMIDDGSSDRSKEICRLFTEKSEKYKYYFQENQGVSAARNLGIKKAKGKWITFVDADDFVTEDYITQIQENIKNVDAVIFGQFCELDGFSEVIQPNTKFLESILGSKKCSLIDNAYPYTVWSKVYKKEIIEKNNLEFIQGLANGEDMLFNVKYYNECKYIKVVKKSIYSYRINQFSASMSYSPNIFKTDKLFLKKLYNIIETDNKELQEIYYKKIIDGFWVCLKANITHIDNRINYKERVKLLIELMNSNPYAEVMGDWRKYISKKKRRIVFYLIEKKMYYLAIWILSFESKKRSSNEYIRGV